MPKAEEKSRNFSGSDTDMLQSSQVMHGLFLEDKPAFVSFDSSFGDPFGSNWLTKINEAGALTNDSLEVAQQVALTKKVEEKLEECKMYYHEMKYFIEKAFPGRKEIWVQFGLNDYSNARKTETKMIQFMGLLSKTSVKYSAELIAAGFSQNKIDKISQLQTELINTDYEQEISKKKRPAITQERIQTMNDCYEFMQKVSKAAKIIFSSDYAKYNQYLLPNETPVKKDDSTPPVNNNNP